MCFAWTILAQFIAAWDARVSQRLHCFPLIATDNPMNRPQEQPPPYDRYLEFRPVPSPPGTTPGLLRPTAASFTASTRHLRDDKPPLPPGVGSSSPQPPCFGSSSPEVGPSSPSPIPYSRDDPAAQCFTLKPPFIYAVSAQGAPAPRYQLEQRLTRSGKPYQLHIRTLTLGESRCLSLPTTLSADSFKGTRDVDFDNDLTLYVVDDTGALNGALFGQLARPEIRPCRRGRCVPGLVSIERGVRGGAWKFWHMTRNEKGDSLRQENEARMQKYGYHTRDEWNRVLLFSAESGRMSGKLSKHWVWKDREGSDVAVEDVPGNLDMRMVVELETKLRDVLIACWTARCWAIGAIPAGTLAK